MHLPEWQSAEAGGGGTAAENCSCTDTSVLASRPNAEGTSLINVLLINVLLKR